MADLTNQLAQDFDFVLVDSPAGIEQGFKNAIAGADQVLIVTTPEVSAVRDADRIIGLVEAAELPTPQLILNRIKPAMVRRGDMLSVDDVKDILAIDLIGIVPEDEQVVVSTNRGEAVVFDQVSRAGKAYHNIARRLLGERVPFQVLEEPAEPPKKGFWARLFGV
jgi:septum site-determining protein MinD